MKSYIGLYLYLCTDHNLLLRVLNYSDCPAGYSVAVMCWYGLPTVKCMSIDVVVCQVDFLGNLPLLSVMSHWSTQSVVLAFRLHLSLAIRPSLLYVKLMTCTHINAGLTVLEWCFLFSINLAVCSLPLSDSTGNSMRDYAGAAPSPHSKIWPPVAPKCSVKWLHCAMFVLVFDSWGCRAQGGRGVNSQALVGLECLTVRYSYFTRKHCKSNIQPTPPVRA